MKPSKEKEKEWRSQHVSCLIDNCSLLLRRDCLVRHLKDKHTDYHDKMKQNGLRVTEEKEFKIASSGYQEVPKISDWRSIKIICLVDECYKTIRRDFLKEHITSKHLEYFNELRDKSVEKIRFVVGKEFKIAVCDEEIKEGDNFTCAQQNRRKEKETRKQKASHKHANQVKQHSVHPPFRSDNLGKNQGGDVDIKE